MSSFLRLCVASTFTIAACGGSDSTPGAASTGTAGAGAAPGAGSGGAAGQAIGAGGRAAAGGDPIAVGKDAVIGALDRSFPKARSPLVASRSHVGWSGAEDPQREPAHAGYLASFAARKVFEVPLPPSADVAALSADTGGDAVFYGVNQPFGGGAFRRSVYEQLGETKQRKLFETTDALGADFALAASETHVCAVDSTTTTCVQRANGNRLEGPGVPTNRPAALSASSLWVVGNGGDLQRWSLTTRESASLLTKIEAVYAKGTNVWALSGDGRLRLSQDDGASFEDVTPPVFTGRKMVTAQPREADLLVGLVGPEGASIHRLQVNGTTSPLVDDVCADLAVLAASAEALFWVCEDRTVQRAAFE